MWTLLDEVDDVAPLCYGEVDATWVASSLFFNLTQVEVPPETKTLYEDWKPVSL